MSSSMRLLQGASMLALAGLAHAQVYKSVGPDGKITFTDKPPTAESAPLRSSNPPPQVQPGPPGAVREDPSGMRPSDRTRFEAARALGNVEQHLRALVEQSVLTHAFGVTCGLAFLEERTRYGTAADRWRERNRAHMQRADQVARDFFGQIGQHRFAAGIQNDAYKNVDAIERGPLTARRAWCETRFQEIAPGGKSDQIMQAGTRALQAYQTKTQ